MYIQMLLYSIMSENEIKKLRARLHLTQRMLADRIGVEPITISRWETGKSRPSHLALRQLRRLDNRAKKEK